LGACLLLAATLSACASYRGSATDVDPKALERESGWVRLRDFPDVRQRGNKDCGAAALSSVLRYHGLSVSSEDVEAELRPAPGRGLRAEALAEFAKQRGLDAFVFNGSLDDVRHELARDRPLIVGVAKAQDTGEWLAHYEVVIGYHPRERRVLTFDPARGLRQNTLAGFMREWQPTERVVLVFLQRAPHVALRQNAAGAQPKMQTFHTAAPIGPD
jgi:ABC-type bacteriocin/lantibiotic exporter with double-glycine peptidase domain